MTTPLHPKPFIAHFDLDSFFVSVEILLHPELKNQPVIVGGTAARGVVASCSYEARKFGVHSAQPVAKALQLCPQAIVVKGSYSKYGEYSKKVAAIIASKVPKFQQASIDEFYCELTGMDRFFDVNQYVSDLRGLIIEETGLPISCGLASAKFIAKMATNEAKPNGFLAVPHGREKDFLGPLQIGKVLGVGKQTEPKLRAMGIATIGDIAKFPKELLVHKLGKWGSELWNRSQGIGSTEVKEDWVQKSMSRETTFQENQTDHCFLQRQLELLTERNAYDLRREGKLTGCVAIKIRYSDFETQSRQEAIGFTALDDDLIEKIRSLFAKLYQKGRPVRLIGVRFTQLADAGMQMSLFSKQEEKLNLYKAIDAIKNRFGSGVVGKAATRKSNS